MVQHAVQAVKVKDVRARTIANIAYGAARSGRGKSLTILFAALTAAPSQTPGHVFLFHVLVKHFFGFGTNA